MKHSTGLPEFDTHLIESFSKHAKSYDRYAQLQKSMAERLASFLPAALKGKTLELGCGTGIFTRHLLAKNPDRILLNDIAPGMIEYLKTHLMIPEATEFWIGNAEHLRFPRVQLIAANAVVQWFQNTAVTFGHLHGALAKNGSLVFSTFGPDTLADFRETAKMEGPTRLISLRQWKRLLAETGFRITASERENRQIFFPDTRHLVKSLQQIGAAPLQIFTAGELRRIMKTYDHNFATPQGVYTQWELLYFAVSPSPANP